MIRAAMEIIPDKRKVVGLIEQAHEGKVCLSTAHRTALSSGQPARR